MTRRAILLAAAALAGCGRLPRPFEGDPGTQARKLAQPPPARLAVPAPVTALLPDTASADYARAVTAALVEQDIPAVAAPARRGDWSLGIAADLRGDRVVPNYSVFDPSGLVQGSVQGAPVDAALWAAASPAVFRQAARADAGGIAALLTRIEAARRQSDPNSLINRPARVLVRDVTGAPGDGNRQLARQLRRLLPPLGPSVTDDPETADFIVQGDVVVAPNAGGNERVEVQWVVADAHGHELGKVVQLNDVEAGTLAKYWGDVALAVAQEAAGGIRDVILNQTGPRNAAPP